MDAAMPPTDKTQTGLDRVYTELFASWRDRPISMLEIGVAQGGSLWFWAQLFPHPESLILGIDLKLPSVHLPATVRLAVCDQNDAATLARLAAAHGPFDLIVDDGCHFTSPTRLCFQTLLPSLKVGGWYVIEDWAVGYWRDQDARYRGMVELVAELLGRIPDLSLAGCRIGLQRGQAYAAFQKGDAGWSC